MSEYKAMREEAANAIANYEIFMIYMLLSRSE